MNKDVGFGIVMGVMGTGFALIVFMIVGAVAASSLIGDLECVARDIPSGRCLSYVKPGVG